MSQLPPNFSARGAIADALRAYADAIQTLQQRESQAKQRQIAESHQAQQARDKRLHDLQQSMQKELERADRIVREVDGLRQQAEQALAELEVPRPSVIPSSQAGLSGTPKQAFAASHAQARGAHADFVAAANELRRVRKTFLVRLRRAIGLPP